MRKAIALFCSLVLAASLAVIPFLCAHCSLIPEIATAYYEKKARKEAQADDAQAELMRLLLGGSAAVETESEPSRPVFSLYGLCLSAGAAAACAAVFAFRAFSGQKKTKALPLFAALALAVPLGLLGARLVYCAANAGFYLHDVQAPEAMPRVWEGGLSLSGALAFAALGGVIASRWWKTPLRDMMDALTPGLLVFACVARLSEAVIGAGYGPELGDSMDALRLPTWLLMAAVPLFLLFLRGGFGRSAFLYGCLMLLPESLRRDGHMMWGFVHAEQVFALCIALPALLFAANKNRKVLWALGATALLVGAVVALEFALDRSPVSDLLLYGVFALAVGAYIRTGLWAEKPRRTKTRC